MEKERVLLSYRDNDLFSSYIPQLGIKATDTVIFSRGTDLEEIQGRMRNATDYDVVITDYTVSSRMPENKAGQVHLDGLVREASKLDLTEKRYIQSFKKILERLNPDNKPVVLVKDCFCDHLPSANWFSSKFACYRKSSEDPTKLEHFVLKGDCETWRKTEEYQKMKEGYNAGLLEFASGWKQKPGRTNNFSPHVCKSASTDLIIDFLQKSCSLNARVVEEFDDVLESEFVIVDRHVFTDRPDDKPEQNIMILPIEDSARQVGDDIVKVSEVREFLKEQLKAYL